MERATTRPRVQVVVTSSEGVWRISMTDRIAKSLGKLRSQANARWPGRNKASDGWIGDSAHRGRESDHNPHIRDRATGDDVVTALDLTHDPNSGCDAGVLAEVVIASRDPRIKYLIWNRRIVSGDAGPSPWVKRPYTGSNPHNMHVHISVKGTKAEYDNDAAWALSGTAPPATPSAPPPPAAVEKRKTLKRRSKHTQDVRYLQKLLGMTVDGVFGRATEEAVKKAQKENGLPADGIVGPYTWAALIK
jgi:peptidoglycan hydrolase-like protein with peptidoglycan-binding domain